MKVLLTTDGSACSQHAIREARRLLPLSRAEVAVVAVTPPPLAGLDPVMGYGMAAGVVDSMQYERDLAATRQHVDEARRFLEADGVRVTEVIRQGDPATAILQVAEEMNPDVIVTGSHGRGPVERFFIGSVSDAIVRRWPGAVMVVRPEE